MLKKFQALLDKMEASDMPETAQYRIDVTKWCNYVIKTVKANPDDPEAFVPNSPMAWGPQPHKGTIFFTDFHSGLWAVRLKDKDEDEEGDAEAEAPSP